MRATYKLKRKLADGTLEDVVLQGQVHFIPRDAFTVVAGSTYNPTKWSVENVSGVTAPTDGMTITVRTPNGGATYGILLSIDDSSNFYPIVRNGSARVTTNYPRNSTLILTFNATQTVSVNLGSITTTTVTGCWQIADYYADYLVSQYNTTTSGNYPLLFKYGVGTTTTTDYTRFADNIYVNPSTGTIYANDFVVGGQSIVGSGSGGLDYTHIYVTAVDNVDYDGDMTMWESKVEFADDNGPIQEKPITINLPLLAGDGIEFTPNSAGDRMVISATNNGGGSSSGGGQPLYRHDIRLYETNNDGFQITFTLINTTAKAYETLTEIYRATEYATSIADNFISVSGSCDGYPANSFYWSQAETISILTGVDQIVTFPPQEADIAVFDTVTSISTASVGGNGGVAQLQQSVTHAELKALRDNGELVAGMQYRITDFVTTTSQPDTQSAGHPFDIIVTALSNNTLSENASADYHKVADVGEATFDPSVLADEDGNLDDGAVVSHYYVFEDFAEGSDVTMEDYKATDEFVAYDYLENGDGVVVPVIYKTDTQAAIDSPEEFGEPDYADIFYYEGTMEVDGVTYDKWRKICETQENGPFWDGRTGYIWALTNVIVNSGSAVDLYFANSNLPAWEIKYCLDNDKTRFAWAVVGDYWISTDFGEKDYILNEKITIDGQEFFKTTHDSVFSLVSQPKTTKELYVYNSTSGELVTFEEDGSAIYDWGEENAGKGVIYYIKDEWDNECPYDFKNIQFKRSTDWFAEHGDWGENVLGYTPTEDKWFYTFTWVDENDEPQDLTLIGNSLLNDEGKINGVFGNKIGICSEYQIYFGENSVEALSYNVFVSSYYCEDGLFYGCYSNTFGNDCDSNTFGNDCYSNTFSNLCYFNTFGNKCSSNTFGNECYSNTFSNDCNYNTFGNGCSKNTLSEYAFCNIFENGVVFVDLTSTTQGNDENRLQYITVSQGVTGAASTRKTINATRNLAYKTTYVAQGSVTTEV